MTENLDETFVRLQRKRRSLMTYVLVIAFTAGFLGTGFFLASLLQIVDPTFVPASPGGQVVYPIAIFLEPIALPGFILSIIGLLTSYLTLRWRYWKTAHRYSFEEEVFLAFYPVYDDLRLYLSTKDLSSRKKALQELHKAIRLLQERKPWSSPAEPRELLGLAGKLERFSAEMSQRLVPALRHGHDQNSSLARDILQKFLTSLLDSFSEAIDQTIIALLALDQAKPQ